MSQLLQQRKQSGLAGCWAHARRLFYDAPEEAPVQAGWILYQSGHLYRIESELRGKRAGAELRKAVRSSQSGMILARIKKALDLK